ncbi:MAG: iron ABC transporter permease [Oscillospiraceae bacterium]|nr:iron ABC transporter permease [Oscillospiraceae bacterium]
MRETARCAWSFVLLTLLLFALAAAGLAVGSVSMAEMPEDVAARILDLRARRVLAAALLGGALAVSGFLLQTFFANPIAGPFVLGVSSGAKLCVALVMVLLLSRGVAVGSAGLYAAAFAGSMLVMLLILLLSGRLQQMALLVVCGVMVGYVCSAVTDLVVTFADDANIVNLRAWSLGSFSGVRWEDLRIIAPVVGVGVGWSFLLAKPMNAYQLGESYAQSLGVELRSFRVQLILLSSVLSACVTAFAGPISFVGVAVPHLMRVLLRTAKPLLMVPACFLGGAVFCLGCDLVARTLFAPNELAIGSVTAVFGAPVVIWMLLARRRRGTL